MARTRIARAPGMIPFLRNMLQQNFIQRILSAGILAPSVTYFVWCSPAFATATVCFFVANACSYEYAWLSLRIHQQLLFRSQLFEKQVIPSDPDPSYTLMPSDLILQEPNIPLSIPHDTNSPPAGDSDSIPFSIFPQSTDSVVFYLSCKYFCSQTWLLAIILSTLASSAMSISFVAIVERIHFLHKTELYAYRWVYGFFCSFAACLAACNCPTWQHSCLLLVQDSVFIFLTMHSVICPINQIDCDFVVSPSYIVTVAILVIFFFRYAFSPRALDFYLHFILDLMGFLYIMGSLSVIVAFVDDDKVILYRKLLIILLYVVWASDTGAYITGKLLVHVHYRNSHCLAPHISKNKDYEGTLGAVVVGVSMMLFISYILDVPGSIIAKVMFAALAVIIGRIGDLFESLLKRVAVVKDSGRLIPGHGGMLDRIDALMFASLIFARYYALVIVPRKLVR